MGQIFNRLKNITNSYINEDKFVDFDIFDNEDEELKQIIDNLNNPKSNKQEFKQEFSNNILIKYYDILGVKHSSSKEEVYVAYKNLLKKYHPDKVATLDINTQEEAQKKSREINFAFQKIKEEKKW